jgi:hypothetical protein
MQLINRHLATAKAPLLPPSTAGYLLLAAAVDRRPPVFASGRAKRALMDAALSMASDVARVPGVEAADVFDARLVALGARRATVRRTDAATPPDAHFDLVVLIQARDPATARALRDDPTYRRLFAVVSAVAERTHEVVARNVRRIADVDHTRRAVFLFNFFSAVDPSVLVPVWEYTAGWFVANTRLSDSTVLEPLAGEPDAFGIINHASWPRYTTFLPALLLRPSFRRFVLANFAANGITVQPILYRRVTPRRRRVSAPGPAGARARRGVRSPRAVA